MVIRRFEAQPDLANRIFLDMGQSELKFIQNFGFFFGFALGIPVAVITHFVTFWWLLPILGVIVGYVTNWLALWMIYEPPDPHRVGPLLIQGLFVRRQPEVADVYARIVADEILTMRNFGDELLNGPQRRPHPADDRGRDGAGSRSRHRTRPQPPFASRSARRSTTASALVRGRAGRAA